MKSAFRNGTIPPGAQTNWPAFVRRRRAAKGRRIQKWALHLRRASAASSSTPSDYAAACGADCDSVRFRRAEATEAAAPSSARQPEALEDRALPSWRPLRRIASASSASLDRRRRPPPLPCASAPYGWDVAAGSCSTCGPASPAPLSNR